MERPPSRHLSAVGCKQLLCDDKPERDADRDRDHQAHDDEYDEPEHRRRVALPGSCRLGAPHSRAFGHNGDAVHQFRRLRRSSCRDSRRPRPHTIRSATSKVTVGPSALIFSSPSCSAR
jgi:hypothetical protein